jgi:steroid 5-alpha reductase family enzyme
MMHWQVFFTGLLAIGLFSLAGWVLSLVRNNVTHVDSMWSLFLGMAAYTYALFFYALTPRTILVLVLVTLWAVRLCVYLTWRNWTPHEDHRYAVIRKNNEPFFWLKSIYIVFGLQAVLAWIISLPLFGAIASSDDVNLNSLEFLDYLGVILVLAGLLLQTVADWQLASFKGKVNNKGKVLDTGVWRYSRHPNYFGECCIWWGFYLIAVSAGAWWSILSPILMTLLLLKVSGVALLEKDIVERRPAYADYIKKTNAFIPGVPKQ